MLSKVASLLSLFTFLYTVNATVSPRTLTQGENLILADCGIGLGANGGSTSREMMYYSGDVWRSDGSVATKPNMMVNVPWDGSYPWRSSGVSAKFPNGDTFKVTINPAIHDPQWAGVSQHTYDSTPLVCYSYHKDKLYQLDDGKWCSSAYVCNHGNAPAPDPRPKPVPQDGLKTSISTNKDFVRLYAQNAGNVFGKLRGKIGDSPNCDETPVDIGGKCAIRFICHSAGGAVSVKKMADFLIDDMTKVDGVVTYDKTTTQVCKKFDTRPGHEGQCLQYVDKVDTYLVVPKRLDVNVDTAPPAGSGRQPAWQGNLNYEITCATSNFNCKLCALIGSVASLTVPWGGVVNVGCNSACLGS